MAAVFQPAPTAAQNARVRRIATAGLLALGLLLTACVPQDGPAETVEYRPRMTATIVRPADGVAQAVVVLVPGGGWTTADPTGLSRLADPFARAGLATVTITYGTESTGDHFPVPVQDLACALGLAAERVPGVPLVLLGHSAGAHLAVLAALAPELGGDGGPDCVAPPRPADAVIGLAGPYDVAATGGAAAHLFGVAPAEDPDLWAEGNPVTWATARPEVAVLLVHGDADRVVGTRFTTDLADALVAAGHPTTVELLPGVGHNDVINPDVVGERVIAWVLGPAVVGSTDDQP